MQANNWMPYPKNKSTEEKQYLVTQQVTPTRKCNSLYENYPGWYDYDFGRGYYEVNGIVTWQPLPNVY